MNAPVKPDPKAFATDQEVRWCPGCGDYAILKAVLKTLAEEEVDPTNTAFISGIGCAARFPYYVETYGFHTIHGRAAAIATGTKLANPDLDVWLASGDGDSLSIGGNHFLHVLRRNVDLVYMLFNNEIYGLTKGQFSPTSRRGTLSPTSPQGSTDDPVNAVRFALGAGARFVARSADVSQPHLVTTLKRAHQHTGASFVEILQNCIVFNKDVFEDIVSKKTAAERQLVLENNAPMIFGAERNKGLMLNVKTLSLDVVTIGENGITEDDILIHDETNLVVANLLAALKRETHPVPMGVIYCNPGETFAPKMAFDKSESRDVLKSMQELMREGHTWTVN
jgi:2-oxoglutarate/2-oxoacid ferredoxin oxidoreductase subunit beta